MHQEEDGSVELHKSAGLRDRGVKKDQNHRDQDRDRDRDRLSRSKWNPADEMIGFSVPRKARTLEQLLLRSGPPVATIPQVLSLSLSLSLYCSIRSSIWPLFSRILLFLIFSLVIFGLLSFQ
ncbi:uncharacterized protein LOC114293553 [Camellia sinensis]|uniref:uncharacterized protein LOC114291018 n=1 Tax=Camellia sinensis TaxID=4442 RepID=UPI001035ED9F|nr:uncharacterized protein LOC114291018 [Camellia sinensis]XP_028093439.1 uncharacterized protein LOC114293553 [Camellia sinensis]